MKLSGYDPVVVAQFYRSGTRIGGFRLQRWFRKLNKKLNFSKISEVRPQLRNPWSSGVDWFSGNFANEQIDNNSVFAENRVCALADLIILTFNFQLQSC